MRSRRSKPEPAGDYVVKTKSGFYWVGDRWIPCNVCAKRMSRAEAHKFAHAHEERVVVRIRVRPDAEKTSP